MSSSAPRGDRLSGGRRDRASLQPRIEGETCGTVIAKPRVMPARFVAYAALASAIVGGFALVADALVVSDEEAVEALVDDLTEDASAGVLVWTDPELEPVSVQVAGRVVRYSAGDESRCADAIGDALSGFEAGAEVVQSSVDVDGDRATVSVRARSAGELHDARFRLVRHGQGWLVTRIVAS